MTDKQIIINGVDVSGCDFLAKEDDYCSYSGVTYAYKGQCMCSDEEMCKEHPKCFYKKVLKQLKRKEQECEELKEGYSELTDIVSPYMDDFTGYNEELGGFDIVLCVKELMEQLDQLKAENDELKKQLMQKDEVDMFFNTPIEGWSNDPCGICPYKAENETYKKMLEDEDVQLALTEIRSGERHLWYNKADKLSKTLTEIKEIAEHCINQDICTFCDYSDKCHIEDEEIPTYDVCKLILQKISEVEE